VQILKQVIRWVTLVMPLFGGKGTDGTPSAESKRKMAEFMRP
jgi:hypothetical protein